MYGYLKVLFGKKNNKIFCLSSELVIKEINFLYGIWLKNMYCMYFLVVFFVY